MIPLGSTPGAGRTTLNFNLNTDATIEPCGTEPTLCAQNSVLWSGLADARRCALAICAKANGRTAFGSRR